MLIKFKKPDPRAGTVAQMDSSLAQHFVNLGYADHHKDGAPPVSVMPPHREALDRALAELPGGNTDPEYVVRAMRSHFGDVFTDDDEVKVRDVVKAKSGKPSDGLKVDDIKAALAEKGVTIPEGVTLKADLAALLDASVQS